MPTTFDILFVVSGCQNEIRQLISRCPLVEFSQPEDTAVGNVEAAAFLDFGVHNTDISQAICTVLQSEELQVVLADMREKDSGVRCRLSVGVLSDSYSWAIKVVASTLKSLAESNIDLLIRNFPCKNVDAS